MTTLATSHYFYTHGLEALIIIGILFTLIGFIVGWLAWRHCRKQAQIIENMNEELVKNIDFQKKLISATR